MARFRSLLFYVKNEDGISPFDFDRCKLGDTLADVFKVVLAVINFNHGHPTPIQEVNGCNAFDFFDWYNERLEPAINVRSIPRPGIVIAVKKSLGDSQVLAATVKLMAQSTQDMAVKNQLASFLTGEKGAFSPSAVDVFLSYGSKDSRLASELRVLFEKEGFECFMAEKDLSPGVIWEEGIRNALQSAAIAVLLLTPQSVSSNWVMCEVGACWVIGKPLIPAVLYINMDTLPEPVRKHQAIVIDTAENRRALIDAVRKLLCETRPGV